MAQFVEISVVCPGPSDAEEMSGLLLEGNLIASAKYFPINIKQRDLAGELSSGAGTLVLMETIEECIEAIELFVIENNKNFWSEEIKESNERYIKSSFSVRKIVRSDPIWDKWAEINIKTARPEKEK